MSKQSGIVWCQKLTNTFIYLIYALKYETTATLKMILMNSCSKTREIKYICMIYIAFLKFLNKKSLRLNAKRDTEEFWSILIIS